MDRLQHAKTKQVELDQTDCRTVIFIPLQDRPARSCCPFDRTHLDDRSVANHHATGMHAQVAREVEELFSEVEDRVGNIRIGIDRGPASAVVLDVFSPRVSAALFVTQAAGGIADSRARPVGVDVCYLSSVVPTMALVDVLDYFLTSAAFNVDINIRWPIPSGDRNRSNSRPSATGSQFVMPSE